jgi:S-adenosylmethionine synthetase
MLSRRQRTAEHVGQGHPDKLADQLADSIMVGYATYETAEFMPREYVLARKLKAATGAYFDAKGLSCLLLLRTNPATTMPRFQ